MSGSARKNVSAWAQFRVLLLKDVRQEFRTGDMIMSMGIYAVLVLIVYGATVATSATSLEILPLAPGLFWALLVFTSLLGLNRTFNREQKNDAIEGLLLAPIDASTIFFSKTLTNVLFIVVVECVALPVFWFLFLADIVLPETAWLVVPALLVGTVGIAGVGTLMSTLTLHTQGKDVLLAVLLIPLVYPLLYACVTASAAVILGSSDAMGSYTTSLVLAGGYDVVMLIAAWALYGFVIEA